ncbi:hypothetical protein Poli38472_014209 [Pythium oligandrum]|uniref:Uncharacterized protein n=1 Tax=Pythium oligandrum TaxID=41045 RepID=A0A8K1CKT6_PYTOL|nr:hypothetical protein Poli38472_014209 [Pythium oligandrum]|eukprot:TMW64092.1 hypothetical protein Poli38472_014209 [Pythium oligandrum]
MTDATRTSSESDDEQLVVDETVDATEDEPRPRKKYKSTYYMRKDEISSLQDEVKQLNATLTELRGDVPEIDTTSLEKVCTENARLHHDLLESDVALARVQAIWSNETATHLRNPLEIFISLAADIEQRRAILNALRVPMLDRGMKYILERTRDMRLDQSQRQTHTVSASNGDHVLIQFDVTPFPNASGVQQVFEKLRFALVNQEFEFWEHLDVTVVCESDGLEMQEASQTHYLVSTPIGVEIEQNFARFWHFSEPSEHLDEPHGVFVVNYVEEDALYPFHPLSRVRIDVSSVLLVRPYRTLGENGTYESGVSVVRWGFSRLLRPQCGLSPHLVQELVDMFPRWGEVIRKELRRHMALQLPVLPSSGMHTV